MNGACANRIPKSMELKQLAYLEIVFCIVYVILAYSLQASRTIYPHIPSNAMLCIYTSKPIAHISIPSVYFLLIGIPINRYLQSLYASPLLFPFPIIQVCPSLQNISLGPTSIISREISHPPNSYCPNSHSQNCFPLSLDALVGRYRMRSRRARRRV